MSQASEEAGCCVVDVCRSGYNPATVAEGWLSLLTGAMGEENPIVELAPPPRSSDAVFKEAERIIGDVRGHLRGHWEFH